MTQEERYFYVMDLATDIKVICEKSENLNKELQRRQKQVFNMFLAQARNVLNHMEQTIPTNDPTFESMENAKYEFTLDLKKQFDKHYEKLQ
jgi:hypothetical protein